VGRWLGEAGGSGVLRSHAQGVTCLCTQEQPAMAWEHSATLPSVALAIPPPSPHRKILAVLGLLLSKGSHPGGAVARRRARTLGAVTLATILPRMLSSGIFVVICMSGWLLHLFSALGWPWATQVLGTTGSWCFGLVGLLFGQAPGGWGALFLAVAHLACLRSDLRTLRLLHAGIVPSLLQVAPNPPPGGRRLVPVVASRLFRLLGKAAKTCLGRASTVLNSVAEAPFRVIRRLFPPASTSGQAAGAW